MLNPAIKFTAITSFRFDAAEKSLADYTLFNAALTSSPSSTTTACVIDDAGLSSLESPVQKSRHEVHFLVEHYDRDGRKKGREWVWPGSEVMG